MHRCCSCFGEYGEEFEICPHCGATKEIRANEAIHLSPGTVLADRYLIGTSAGAGGFGIIYKAWDMKLETIVAVKEFFASRLVTRAAGTKDVIINKKSQAEFEYRKARFLAEARDMSKFGSHRSIPNVFEYFEENHTAYIVMELLVGEALNEYLHINHQKIDMDFALLIANEVGNALKSMHEKGIIHRDVAPDNIFICNEKEIKIKLLDLGAAKLADSTDEVIDIILKPGYSPTEQYDNSKSIGPWTDIYALGATLYVMLTGVKPDESTNRKIKDELIAPKELNPDISDNLNNTILKAMAIDRHMRFKNVNEFLSAINGERKVLTLAKEKKRRNLKRWLGVAAACVVLVVSGGIVWNNYNAKKAAETLKPADITIWFSVAEDSTEEAAVESMISDFTSNFKDVEITYKAIPEEDYASEIQKAAKDGKLPTLFESTGIDEGVLEKAKDVDKVLESEQFKNALFLGQYRTYYKNSKKVPLAIEIPVAFVITNGAVSVDYEEKYYEALSDFGYDNIAVDERYRELMEANYDVAKYVATNEDFFNNESNTSAILLSTTMRINEVRTKLTNYEKTYVYPKTDEIVCQYTYEWSIGAGDKNEIAAGERLLSWMLGNVYQSTLMINKCNDGQIPVNKKCFDTKIETKNLQPIAEIYENFVFKGEQ